MAAVHGRARSPGSLYEDDGILEAIRGRANRQAIRDEWIERAISSPVREAVRADGRIGRRASIPEMDNRTLRVTLLPDGETVHNAFFDRRFVP
jgi:hypothetical protein